MKKLVLVILLFSCSFLQAKFVKISENPQSFTFETLSGRGESIELSFALNGYEIKTITETGETFHKIFHEDAGKFLQVGKPDLPLFSRFIAIPNQGKVTYEIKSVEREIIPNIKVYPQQKLQSESKITDDKFAIDTEFYKTGGNFPAELIQIGTPVIMRNLRMVNLTIQPFQFNPKSKEVTYHEACLVECHYESEYSNDAEIIHTYSTNPEIPQETHIENVYPNPFNPQNSDLNIDFGLAKTTDVKISVYNIRGKKVTELTNESFNQGFHSLSWNGRDERKNILPSGVYFYKISAGDYSEVKKMMLLR